MKRKNDIQEELENLSPFLAEKLKKQPSFEETSPEYWSKMQYLVFQKLKEERETLKQPILSPSSRKVLKLHQWQWVAWSAAAMVAGAIVVTIGFYRNNSESGIVANELKNITPSEALAYIVENYDSFSAESIAETHFDHETVFNLAEDVSEEEINSYLNDNLESIEVELLKEIL